jgi:histidinol-phosphate aminotransferase
MIPLRLHLNEHTDGCSPAVLSAIQRLTRRQIGAYPDVDAATRAAEQWFGVPAGWLVLTNGLDDGLRAAAQAAARSAWQAGGPLPEALVIEPAFDMYAACADAAGLRVVRVAPQANLRFPESTVLASLNPAVRVIYLNDPNNPTGLAIPDGAISRIAEAAERVLVVVDEAYAEFSGRTIIGPELDRRRHVIVGRTFAKAFGLAGLRIGALVGHPDALAPVRRVLPPFGLNVIAAHALVVALDDRGYLDWYVGQSIESRELIYAWADRLGLPYLPSEGNFVLIRVGDGASEIVAQLAADAVLVRDRSPLPGCGGCIRITAGLVADTRRGLAALEACLASRTR